MNEQTLTFLQLLVEAKNINSCASLSVFGTFRTLLTIENQHSTNTKKGTNKSYDDSVKLKRTEMDPFRLEEAGLKLDRAREIQREPEPDNID